MLPLSNREDLPRHYPPSLSAVGIAHELRPAVAYRPYPARLDEPIATPLRHPSGQTGAVSSLRVGIHPFCIGTGSDDPPRTKLGERDGPSCFGRHLPGAPCLQKRVGRGRRPLTSRKPRTGPQVHHDVSWGHMRGGANRDVHLQPRSKMSLFFLAWYVALCTRGSQNRLAVR